MHIITLMGELHRSSDYRLKESQGQLNKLPICVARPRWLHFFSFILGPQSCPLLALHN